LSDVFEEVEESLRTDKSAELWNKYGWIAYLLAALIIAAVAANEYISYQAEKADEARVMRLETAESALSNGDYAGAEEILVELVEEDSKLTPLAAQLLARTRLEGGGDAAGAMTALQKAIGGDDPYAQLAALKAAYLDVDNLTLAELEATLSGLKEDKGPIGSLALELIAAKAYSEGNFARARADYQFLLIAPNPAPGVVDRANVALTVIPVTETEPTAPALVNGSSETETIEEGGQ